MELELKYKLSAESDYYKLRSYLDAHYSGVILLQKNYFYDTENMLLIKHNAVLRVRVQNKKVIITFKEQKEKKEGYFISDEIENTVSLEEIEPVLAVEKSVLSVCGENKNNVERITGNSDLVQVGMFSTQRIKYSIDDVVLELDRVDFGKGVVDYEIETESEDEEKVRAFLCSLMESLNVQFQPQEKTKYQRFLESRNIFPLS